MGVEKYIKEIGFLLMGFLCLLSIAHSQTIYPNNEDGEFEDMLTPQYYLSANGEPFRVEVNKFVHFSRELPFQHPLDDGTGQLPQYSIPTKGEFGAGKGPGDTAEYHPAIDLHVGNNETNVTMYAAHDGLVAVYKDAQMYRHYLSITRDIEDDSGNILGKMVTLYAHIDLDLDSADNIILDGQYINQGDIVSKHLYSGTVGGPHLHFEIRYYRPGDMGTETFYGFSPTGGGAYLSQPSAGSWSYGYWHASFGYGYANPENHLLASAGINESSPDYVINVFPNPVSNFLTIDFPIPLSRIIISIYSIHGQLMEQNEYSSISQINCDLSRYPSGFYLIQITENENRVKRFFKIIKE